MVGGDRTAFETGSRVVAVSHDGARILCRADGKLTLWSSRGEKLRAVSRPDDEGPLEPWYAVSTTGDVAEADSDAVRVLEPDGGVRWERTAEGWQPEKSEGFAARTLWGPPSFSPDGSRLATLHHDGICLWDSRTGALVKRAGSDRLPLVRALAFAPDGKRAVLWGLPSAEERIAFVVDLEDEAEGVLPVELPFQKGGVVQASFVGPGEIATLDKVGTIRWYAMDGTLTSELPFPTYLLAFAIASGEGRIVATSGDGRVVLWDAAARTLSTLREQGGEVRFIGPPADAGAAWLIEVGGAVVHVSAPDEAERVPLARLDVDPVSARHRRFFALLGGGDFDAAIAHLERFHSDDGDLRFRIALHYANLRRETGRPCDLIAYLREHEMPPEDPRIAASILSLASVGLENGATALAVELYRNWFRTRRMHPNLAVEDERAIRLGRELGTALRRDVGDLPATRFLGALVNHWPGRWELTEALANALTPYSALDAADVVESFLSSHGSDLRAWKTLASICWHARHAEPNGQREVEWMLSEAALQLDLSQQWSHEFLGAGYLRLGRKDLAARHYEAALRIAPDEPEYVEKLAEIGISPE